MVIKQGIITYSLSYGFILKSVQFYEITVNSFDDSTLSGRNGVVCIWVNFIFIRIINYSVRKWSLIQFIQMLGCCNCLSSGMELYFSSCAKIVIDWFMELNQFLKFCGVSSVIKIYVLIIMFFWRCQSQIFWKVNK